MIRKFFKKLSKKSKKKANTEIKTVKKLKDNMYMINDMVVFKVLSDGEIKADYDPEQLSEREVNELIDNFFSVVLK
jgi:hypothetical protein